MVPLDAESRDEKKLQKKTGKNGQKLHQKLDNTNIRPKIYLRVK